MKKFYCETAYSGDWNGAKQGKITEISVDENGVKQINKLDFFPVVYENCDFSDQKDFYGNFVKPVPINSLYKYKQEIENIGNHLGYSGDVKEHHQFIHQVYSEIGKQPDIPFISYDIEVLTSDVQPDGKIKSTGFPEANIASRPITAITLTPSNADPIVLAYGDYTGKYKDFYVKCKNEKDVILKFFDAIKPYVIITGWNISQFDNVYVLRRAINLNMNVINFFPIHKKDPEKLFKKKKITVAGGRTYYNITASFPGYVIWDYMELFKHYERDNYQSYALNSIAEIKLGKTKLDWSEKYSSLDDMYFKDFNMYIDYNVVDSLLINKLDDKLKYIKLAIQIAYLTHSNFSEIFYPTAIWANYINDELLKKNIIPRKQGYYHPESFLGGFVKTPIPGKYKWVVSFDVSSMHPSLYYNGNFSELALIDKVHDHIIRPSDDYMNPSHIDTLLETSTEDIRKLRKEDETISLAGYHFRKKQDILGSIIERAYKLKEEYADQKAKSTTDADKEYYEGLRYAIKIFINSFYGALSQKFFRYFCQESARSITESSQYLVKKVGNKLAETIGDTDNGGSSFIYSDTDSLVFLSNLQTNKGDIMIGDLYNKGFNEREISKGKFVVEVNNYTSASFNKKTKQVEHKNITYVMKHKVKKKMYKITVGDKSVTCTEDHSVIVQRDNTYIDISPKEIIKGDKIIKLK